MSKEKKKKKKKKAAQKRAKRNFEKRDGAFRGDVFFARGRGFIGRIGECERAGGKIIYIIPFLRVIYATCERQLFRRKKRRSPFVLHRFF